jgi:hypothetical protein
MDFGLSLEVTTGIPQFLFVEMLRKKYGPQIINTEKYIMSRFTNCILQLLSLRRLNEEV